MQLTDSVDRSFTRRDAIRLMGYCCVSQRVGMCNYTGIITPDQMFLDAFNPMPLKDIIGLAEADKGANTVIFHCVDGYTTSLPLQTIIDRNMILAYSSNGITLPPSLGYPFIVVAEDNLGYKWARLVDEIEVSDNSKYTGYWESRGYSNEADVR